MSQAPAIHTFTDAQELTRAAAGLFLEVGKQAIAERNRFLVALSGGSTPKALYSILANDKYAQQLDWVKGTALRPLLDLLTGPDERAAFLADLDAALLSAYPRGPLGVAFPFRRIFAVASRSAGPDAPQPAKKRTIRPS